MSIPYSRSNLLFGVSDADGEGEKDLGDDTGDKDKEDGGEGKFEYVTSTERGSSQVW